MNTEATLNEFIDTKKKAIITVGLFSLVTSFLMLVIPLFTLQVLDRVISTRSVDTLIMLFVGAFFVLLLTSVLYLIRERIMSRIAIQVHEKIAPLIFRLLLKESAKNKENNQSNYLRDVYLLRYFFSGKAIFIFFEMIWVPVFISIIFLLSPMLGAVVGVAAVMILLLSLIAERIVRPQEAITEKNKLNNINQERLFISNAEVIEAMGMSSHVQNIWHKQQIRDYSTDLKADDVLSIIQSLMMLIRSTLNISLMAVGAWLVINEYLSVGVVIASLIIGMRAISPLESFIKSWRSINLFREIYRRLKNQINDVDKFKNNYAVTGVLKGNISVKNLVYVPFSGAKPILKGISFDLQSGKVMGITGPNGSGKSTLIKNVLGLYKPVSGSINIDDYDVTTLNRELLGNQLGYMKQDAELMPGTIAENISRLQPSPIDAVIDAAKLAGAHELIMSLKDGYSTEIKDGGSNLSGGQRQIIALARAVFGEPAFVVLDEPTAMLDMKETELVARMLARLRNAGITILVVTHQTRLLKEVDQIMVMKDGLIDSISPFNRRSAA